MKRFFQRFVPMYHGFLNKIHKLVHGNPIVISDASDKALVGLRVFGKSTQNGTPTPDAPVEIASVENPMLNVYGKNLLCATEDRMSTMGNGITFESKKGSSEFIFGGTQLGTNPASGLLIRSMTILPGTYTFSVYGLSGNDYVNIKNISGEQNYLFTGATTKKTKTFVVDKVMNISVEVVVYSTSTYDNTKVTAQLEFGLTATEYEPCKEVQSLTIPYTIHGIPVASGGNYTDANGQQWICDEVDFKRGVYVHRIKSSIVNGSSNIHKNENNENSWLYCYKTENNDIDTKICAICNRLHYIRMNESDKGSVGFNNASGNYGVIYINLSSYMVENTLVEFKRVVDEYPLTFLYALKVPIETPLTADQIAAYKALHTNEPNTTISNDKDAWMEVNYISN